MQSLIMYTIQLEDENIELTKQNEKLKETCDRLTADLMELEIKNEQLEREVEVLGDFNE